MIPQEEAVRDKAVDKSADAAGMSGQLPGSCLAGGAGRSGDGLRRDAAGTGAGQLNVPFLALFVFLNDALNLGEWKRQGGAISESPLGECVFLRRDFYIRVRGRWTRSAIHSPTRGA